MNSKIWNGDDDSFVADQPNRSYEQMRPVEGAETSPFSTEDTEEVYFGSQREQFIEKFRADLYDNDRRDEEDLEEQGERRQTMAVETGVAGQESHSDTGSEGEKQAPTVAAPRRSSGRHNQGLRARRATYSEGDMIAVLKDIEKKKKREKNAEYQKRHRDLEKRKKFDMRIRLQHLEEENAALKASVARLSAQLAKGAPPPVPESR